MASKINICCGPIVGLITSNSVNILLEFDDDIKGVRCIFINRSNPNLSKISEAKPSGLPTFEVPINDDKLDFKKGISKVVRYIIDLPENSKIEFKVIDTRIANLEYGTARFHTFSSSPLNFSTICVSNECGQNNELLKNLHDRIVKEDGDSVDLLLHLGGQVDLCEIINNLLQSQEVINSMNRMNHDQLTNFLKEEFRKCYRRNFTSEYMRKLLSICQNLMIWNEKDSLIGYNQTHWKSKIKVQVDLVRCAHSIYCEYQRQLWDPVYIKNPQKLREHHAHKWGKYGLFIFDTKGNLYSGNEMISGSQITHLKKFVENPSDMEILIFVSDMPFVSDIPVECLKKAMNGEESLINTWPCRESSYYLIYRFLEKWQRDNKNKKVLLISGNSPNHMYGSNTEITNKMGNFTMSQISVGSNMANAQPNISGLPIKLRYKKWEIIQTPILDDNYGSVSLFIKDGLNNLSTEIVTLSGKHKMVSSSTQLEDLSMVPSYPNQLIEESIALAKLNERIKTSAEISDDFIKINDILRPMIVDVQDDEIPTTESGIGIAQQLLGESMTESEMPKIIQKQLKGPIKQEPVKREPVKREPVKQEPVKQEPVKQEPVKQEPVKQEPVKREPVKQEPVKREPVKQEPVKQEPVKQQQKVNNKIKIPPNLTPSSPQDSELIKEPSTIDKEYYDKLLNYLSENFSTENKKMKFIKDNNEDDENDDDNIEDEEEEILKNAIDNILNKMDDRNQISSENNNVKIISDKGSDISVKSKERKSKYYLA
jgi:hypothetical protein